MEPWLVWDNHSIEEWLEHDTIKELSEYVDQVAEDVKEDTGYYWDDVRAFLRNVQPQPVLRVGFYDDEISFWSALTGRKIGDIDELSESNIARIKVWAKKVEDGLHRCGECKDWVEDYKTYSFAGAVCEPCYDPKKHRKPITH